MKKFMRTRADAGHRQHQHQQHQHPQHQHPQPAAAARAHFNGHSFSYKTNGHANGVGAAPGGGVVAPLPPDHHSTLSRYWSGESSESRGARGSRAAPPPRPWADPHFAPSRALARIKGAADIRWMRPMELCNRPRFRGDNLGAADGEEDGDEGDEGGPRWTLEAGGLCGGGGGGGAGVGAAAAALAGTPRLLDRVIPRGQTFAPPAYTGAFRFKFWVFGSWRDVVVDDRLPTRQGQALFTRCALRDDFTLPLLEKAYAKLYGGYAALREGDGEGDGDGDGTALALQDLSGGIVQSFCLRRQARALTLQVVASAAPRATLVVATAAAPPPAPRGGPPPLQPHCVEGVARVRPHAAEVALVLLRAVGGAAGEGGPWRSAWAPPSPQWRALAPEDRAALASRIVSPNHFWMSFEEFASTFDMLQLVHLGPDEWMAEGALRSRAPWRAVVARRRWVRGVSAGGPPSAPTAPHNPRFQLAVARACHAVIAVSQRHQPRRRTPRRAVGFAVYEAGAGGGGGGGGGGPPDVAHCCAARETATFFTLRAGHYAVVPHTAHAHQDAAFLLRVFTDEQADVWEVNEDNLILRDLMAEFLADSRTIPADVRRKVGRALRKRGVAGAGASASAGEWEWGDEADVDCAALRRLLRCVGVRVSAEACAALVALRDREARGAMPAGEATALAALVATWAAAFRRHTADERAGGGGGGGGGCSPLRRGGWRWRGLGRGRGRCSSYGVRALLRAAGVSASNKVAEGLVVRFGRGAELSFAEDAFLLAMARLHLAHERHRCLDAKLKSNPLSLEEMILMTIYS